MLDVNLTIIGCGGIGQAVVFALNQFKLRGKITLIDPDIIDESNRQRYLLAFDETVRMNKTIYLSQFLMNIKNHFLTTLEFLWNYETSISIFDSLFNMELENMIF
jgi:tRNA A37 threonylcarbamoyladenosine dehydratase